MEQKEQLNTNNLQKLKEIFLQPKQELSSIKIQLEDFDSPKWEYYHSPGKIDHTKVWIQKFMNDEQGAFEECCQAISHQMTFYSVIYLVFPYLVEKIARDFEHYDKETLVRYISELGVSLSVDCPLNTQGKYEGADISGLENDTLRKIYVTGTVQTDDTVLENYQLSIQKFQLLIKHFLSRHIKALGRMDKMTKTMFALAVLAAFGNRNDAFLFLMPEIDECIGVGCNRCDFCDEESLEFSNKKAMSVIKQRGPAEDNWDGVNFEDTYLWFGDFLELMQGKSLSKHLPYYFGTFCCPECGNEAEVRTFMDY